MFINNLFLIALFSNCGSLGLGRRDGGGGGGQVCCHYYVGGNFKRCKKKERRKLSNCQLPHGRQSYNNFFSVKTQKKVKKLLLLLLQKSAVAYFSHCSKIIIETLLFHSVTHSLQLSFNFSSLKLFKLKSAPPPPLALAFQAGKFMSNNQAATAATAAAVIYQIDCQCAGGLLAENKKERKKAAKIATKLLLLLLLRREKARSNVTSSFCVALLGLLLFFKVALSSFCLPALFQRN